ncbi:MAG TPA: PEP/pyruvate-binding domain-containing protein, partial [Microthrixaceae bacterium]|nr:PEP/pyruvate-binding domain-containing protein [Microthrixaceae bacterium]
PAWDHTSRTGFGKNSQVLTGEMNDGASSDSGGLVVWLDEINEDHPGSVGHKSVNLARVRRLASLGQGSIVVPDGFVVTTRATVDLLDGSGHLAELKRLWGGHVSGELDVRSFSTAALNLFGDLSIPDWLRSAIGESYERMPLGPPGDELLLAVRSNAVMEDSIGTSYAGQFESVLGVATIDDLLAAYLDVIRSSLTQRVLSYQQAVGQTTLGPTGMSVLVQRMVRSDRGSAGVVISSTPGFRPIGPDATDLRSADLDSTGSHLRERVTTIEVVRGTAEVIVGGSVNPESLTVRMSDRSVWRDATRPAPESASKESSPAGSGTDGSTPDSPAPDSSTSNVTSILDDATALALGELAQILEVEFGSPVEVEWARDDRSDELAVVQVRPIPAGAHVDSRGHARTVAGTHISGLTALAQGLAIGTGQVSGPAVVVDDPRALLESDDLGKLPDEFILVVSTTSPEWVPLMRLASALVTDHGGRGSHAAIVCREIGLPAVLGCGSATSALRAEPDQSAIWPSRHVVVDCEDGGRGVVYG